MIALSGRDTSASSFPSNTHTQCIGGLSISFSSAACELFPAGFRNPVAVLAMVTAVS